MVQISERQEHIGPQPTVLKNTVAAIIAAVWFDSRDYLVTAQVVAFLG
jgi:dsRNA-specific ribonuclease